MTETADFTRLITKSAQAAPVQKGGIISAADADIFQLLPNDVVRGLNRSSEAQRVLSEMRYLDYYAAEIGRAAGFAGADLMIVEDAEHQTGFRRMSPQGGEAVHGGLTRVGRKRLGQVRKELGMAD